ncbi:MAG TPA: hypothetical protein VMG59_08840 [Phycisphaerae bacterium]|nr:hypothetical protein [Phycisphaerae bacterium]
MKLNSFQKMMNRWSALGPYNAAQAMCVSGAPDVERWRAAIHAGVASVGLGPARITGDTVKFTPLTEISLKTTRDDLALELESQINLPFAAGDMPLRFTLVCQADRYWLLFVYDHWLADSWSIRQLIQICGLRYTGQNEAPQLRMSERDFRSTFRHRLGFSPAITSLTTGLRQFIRHRRVWRMHINDPLNFSTQILIRDFPDGLIERLAQYAKARECTVNDLFLAASAAALGRYYLTRYDMRQGRWPFYKTGLGIGAIVDIRARADRPLDDVFGLYLSFCTLVLKKPEACPFAELLEDVSQHTRRFKSRDEGVKFFSSLDIAWMLWRLYDRTHFLSPVFRSKNPDRGSSERRVARVQADFFRRNAHVMAGISNVNLNDSWVYDRHRDVKNALHILDYLRVSPAGPLSPMVFALTTLGSKMSLCFTWRKTALDRFQVERFVADFIKTLKGLGTV